MNPRRSFESVACRKKTSFQVSPFLSDLPQQVYRIRKHKEQKESSEQRLKNALKPFDYDEDCSDSSYEMVEADEDTYQKTELFSVLKIDHYTEQQFSNINKTQVRNPYEYTEGADGSLETASMIQLILELTSPKLSDPDFTKQFILTFPSFMKPPQLLCALFTRYYAPAGEPGVNVSNATELRQIRDRIIRILSSWLKLAPYQFDENMIKAIDQFCDYNANSTAGMVLSSALQFVSQNHTQRRETIQVDKICKPILPQGPNTSWQLENFDPLELAHQLSIYYFHLFAEVGPLELLSTIWGIKAGTTEHLDMLTNKFDVLNNFVILTVLTGIEPKNRAQQYIYWVDVAKESKAINNYFVCFSIVYGLTHPCVTRLKETQAIIKKQYYRTYEKTISSLIDFCSISSNFQNYRDELTTITGRCIPFIGCLQKDLIYISESFPNTIGGLINWKKCVACTQIIQTIQKYQCVDYPYYPIDRAQTLIEELKEPMTSAELMKFSMSVEHKAV